MNARRHPSTTVALGLLALVTVACSSGASAGEPASADDLEDADVVIVAEDMAFIDPPQEIEAGTITIGLDNQGSASHDVTFDGPVGTVVAADGGGQAIAEVTLEPGTYTVYCAVSGHRQAGMELDVNVR